MPHPPKRRDIRLGLSSARQVFARARPAKAEPARPSTQSPDRPDASAAYRATSKRLDLQGLRAVAVLLVALNHANVPFMTGGYIGVDVFFVLSGYFITGLLFRDGFGRGDNLGQIRIRDFYARRARRILPAACLTLLTTSIAVYVIYDLMRDDFLGTKTALEDALSASLFFANIHFAQTATNYFAQATATLPSPFQHFWSLSVEEQFYVVWPSLLAITFFICRKLGRDPEHRRRNATRAAGVLIVLACAAALVWSIRDTAVDPQAAYFSTPARAWELGLGAGLALLAARGPSLPALRGLTRALLSFVGLALIALAAVAYSSKTSFPGDAALLPVAGSGLVVLAGMAPAGRFGLDRLLATRPMTYIGDRSYSFYLWHYPVLILVWQVNGHVLPVGVNLALLAGAFLIADLTFDFYENPLRFARWLRGWRTAAMAAVSMSAAVLATLTLLSAFQATLAAEATAADRAHVAGLKPARGQSDPRSLWASKAIPDVSAAVSAVRHNLRLPKQIVPSLQELSRENTYISYGMHRGCQPAFGPGTKSKVCMLGDSTSHNRVAVIGDSHGGMWVPALEADGSQQGFAVVPLDKPGCVLNVIHENLAGWPCADWYRWALNEDRKLHPVATIVAFEFTPKLQADPSSTTAELEAVLGQVTRGVLLADPPGQNEQPSACISQAGATMSECSDQLASTYVPLMKDLAAMAARTHHPAIPTLQWFCADGTCPMVIDRTLTLRDKSHFTMEYSTLLAPVLGLELKPILARFEHQ